MNTYYIVRVRGIFENIKTEYSEVFNSFNDAKKVFDREYRQKEFKYKKSVGIVKVLTSKKIDKDNCWDIYVPLIECVYFSNEKEKTLEEWKEENSLDEISKTIYHIRTVRDEEEEPEYIDELWDEE